MSSEAPRWDGPPVPKGGAEENAREVPPLAADGESSDAGHKAYGRVTLRRGRSLTIVRLPIYTRKMTLREPTFLILTSLASGPRHGYGILQDVSELSDGRVRIRAGTLYGSLDRLVDEGLVVPDREEIENGRLRRYYRITGEGRSVLAAEAERMVANARAATARLNMRGRMV